MNRWNIPSLLEKQIVERDTHCVYCNTEFTNNPLPRGNKPSWEHIINDASIITYDNIARCCVSCNSSKGSKNLKKWLESTYCSKKNITQYSVAPVVKKHLNQI